MPSVHATAILNGHVELAEDVIIGPGCTLDGETGPIRVGAGTRLIGNVYLTGPLVLGERNTIWPFACLGFAPQDIRWDPARPGAGLVIGGDNVFREHVTVHRATSEATPTTIGSHNYFMASSHVGHDCRVGEHCIFANATLLGGHAHVADRVITGGMAGVHQFCRIGRGAMLSGAIAMTQDLPPYFTLTGFNHAGSINLVGLRRSGATRDTIECVRWVFKTLYRRGLSLKSALDELRQRQETPIIREYVEFIETSKRGICPAVQKHGRVAAAPVSD
jgi:UDP-N-acetylglucosamine acyltransferase